jgi:trans-aconitate methyltransferase
MRTDWNPELYQSSHSFVWQYGKDLLTLLAAEKGERVLDVGCGTGQLTNEVAGSGAEVVGIDQSPAMIEQARRNYPQIRFEVQDMCTMSFSGEFDAVFSNAALHWVTKAGQAAGAIARALKPGGRFVAELGGRGNTRALLEAVRRAMAEIEGEDPGAVNPWFYPSLGEYASLLERHGLEVQYAVLFDRFTKIEGGLAKWLAMFGKKLTGRVPEARREELAALVEQFAAKELWRDGAWHVDYRRLRLVARKL